jgi:hypothetical protein
LLQPERLADILVTEAGLGCLELSLTLLQEKSSFTGRGGMLCAPVASRPGFAREGRARDGPRRSCRTIYRAWFAGGKEQGKASSAPDSGAAVRERQYFCEMRWRYYCAGPALRNTHHSWPSVRRST